jgi:hypothetical protein
MGLEVVRRRLGVKSSTINLTVIVTRPPGLTERGFTLAWTRFSALTVDCEKGGGEGEGRGRGRRREEGAREGKRGQERT